MINTRAFVFFTLLIALVGGGLIYRFYSPLMTLIVCLFGFGSIAIIGSIYVNSISNPKTKKTNKMKSIFSTEYIGVDKDDPSLLYLKEYPMCRLRVQLSVKSIDRAYIQFVAPVNVSSDDIAQLSQVSKSILDVVCKDQQKATEITIFKTSASKWEDFSKEIIEICMDMQISRLYPRGFPKKKEMVGLDSRV